MSRDPATLAADEEPGVQAEVQRAAVRQLLAGGPFAESLHVLLVLVVAALVWNSLSLGLIVGWVSAVTAAALLRTWWRLQIGKRTPSAEEALRGVRLTVAGIGLAWGVGAAPAVPALQPHEGALILVVLTGIIAGATSALVGDRRSFRYLLLTTLAPIPFGILLQGQARFNVIAVVLIALFALGMDRVHRRGYRTFAERVRGGVLLELSTQELARQHAYLDALIASTPVAIAVLDDQRSVRSVNAAFESLFGYAAAEVVGAGIDGLIVPESLRSESTELETRVRRGETVRVEVERMRKDGRRIQVRLSAAAVKAAADGALVALYEDISDRKAAEAAMREARDLAERVARARSAFLANMSHEIRTPMNAVLGFVELVLDTELAPEQRRAPRRAPDGAGRSDPRAAGPHESDRQRDQVHRGGPGGRVGQRDAARRRRRGRTVPCPRYGNRHPGGAARHDFPGVHAGRRVDDATLRRDGPRPRHLAAARGPDGRRARGHERSGLRQRVQLHAPPPARGGPGRGARDGVTRRTPAAGGGRQ